MSQDLVPATEKENSSSNGETSKNQRVNPRIDPNFNVINVTNLDTLRLNALNGKK